MSFSGCDTGLLGQQGKVIVRTGVPASPLPPLKLDAKAVNPDQQLLYGRVVIDGKPAKKDSLQIIAVPDKVLRDAGGDVTKLTGAAGSGPVKIAERKLTTSVAKDDGLYMLKGPIPGGNYTLYFEFGPEFQGHEAKAERYVSPFTSPFKVKMRKGNVMQDLVLELKAP